MLMISVMLYRRATVTVAARTFWAGSVRASASRVAARASTGKSAEANCAADGWGVGSRKAMPVAAQARRARLAKRESRAAAGVGDGLAARVMGNCGVGR